jgi:hypothetical protein
MQTQEEIDSNDFKVKQTRRRKIINERLFDPEISRQARQKESKHRIHERKCTLG